MAPRTEKSSLKRVRNTEDEDTDVKKPRRSARLGSDLSNVAHEHVTKQAGLPSPVTADKSPDSIQPQSTRIANLDEPEQRKTPELSPPPSSLRASQPNDTQPYSQFIAPPPYSYEVANEEEEGVWGYMLPLDGISDVLVLRKRAACPLPNKRLDSKKSNKTVSKKHYEKKEEEYEQSKITSVPSGGFLLGRHPECDRIIDEPTVSNRHALIFSENKDGSATALLEDLSGNGTYVNDAIIGRNKRRELHDADEISIAAAARFIFRYPRSRESNAFRQHYTMQGMLGKGHFASVYLCTEKNSGMRYAVKRFEKRSGPGEKSKMDGLQQEIAVLMGVSHPNMLCLKDCYDERDGVYLVLELAPEGELFNWIIMKHKLTEDETRKVFVQLFQGIKYLHDRNIVHRDIKPENILLVDKELTVKVADFGLAKIIGEESFTTTLCGTPSYVAPEILENTNRRRYTRAVDVWSLGVVLYICLCGFPPFSDELYTTDNPYTLSQQIKMGRFDYPSPYWDSVGDPALDLIDKMLTVDVDKRATIEDCLEHPWTTKRAINPTDSTDGLTGALQGLDFSKRKPQRERTLLSSVNEITVEREIDTHDDKPKVKVWGKNLHSQSQSQSQQNGANGKAHSKPHPSRPEFTVEPAPDGARNVDEFVEMGGKGDQILYDENVSRYPDSTMKAGAPDSQAG